MSLEKLIETIDVQNREVRSKYHVTIGQLIEHLSMAKDAPVVVDFQGIKCSVKRASSYRGYYSDLALEPTPEKGTAAELLLFLNNNVLDKELEGYKGGEFLMDADKPVWVALYGATGEALVDTQLVNGEFVLITKNVD